MTVEQKMCENCAYEYCELDEFPCTRCKHNKVKGTEEYETAHLMWEPQGSVRDNKQHDSVSHPSHYCQGNIECIDAMVAAYGEEAVSIFCLLNAFKYLWRSEHKNGKEDLEKATWYLKKRLELCESE